jgi:hypothetical protein
MLFLLFLSINLHFYCRYIHTNHFLKSKLNSLALHMHSFQLCLCFCAHIRKNYLVLFVVIRKFPCQARQMFLELIAQLSHWISNQYQIYCPGDASP